MRYSVNVPNFGEFAIPEGKRATFRVMMAGQDVPRLFCSGTDRDGDFDGAVPDPQVVAAAWDA